MAFETDESPKHVQPYRSIVCSHRQGDVVEEGMVLSFQHDVTMEANFGEIGEKQFSAILCYCEVSSPPSRQTEGQWIRPS